MDIKEKALLMTPCEVCEMLGQKRGCRPEDDRYTCGITEKEMTPAALQRDRGRNERTLCRLLL